MANKYWMTWAMMVCLCISTLGGAYIGYLSFIDGVYVNQPITIEDSLNIPVLQPVYHPGDVVVGHSKFCKHSNVPAEFQWQLIDTVLTYYPERSSTLKAGCHDSDFEIQKLPDIAHTGDYHFETTISYQVNPLRTIQVPMKTQTFRVEQR